MRSLLVGAALLVVGLLAVLTGVLPTSDALELVERVWPILLFVVAITVVTELAADAGLFRAVAERLARWGRRRTLVLWLLIIVLATASTVFLSLDTTAVLLTPVVVVLARHIGVSPIPFALTTVWLANTGSLLLPVSNLTNLLAQHELDGVDPATFASVTAVPALVAVVVPLVIVFVVYRRDLVGTYEPETAEPAADRILLTISGIVIVLLVPALVSGVEVWLPATIAAVVLLAVFAVRRPAVVRPNLVPWSLLVMASGLFLVVEAGHALGLADLLGRVIGSGDDLGSLLGVAGAGALGANVANNLPAYLALEPIAGSPERLVALLIGVNAGPLITPWASLATLLWHERLKAEGVEISWPRYALLGLVAAPLTVGLAVVAFALTR
ncbi:SLC13 family permease [Herbiconiux sp. L3-i23]|uniref:SLC13 family permease n=1 Tax=Herbiconiux sp. L3-i23 TaxID=2905871 RepID=UPI00204E4E0E|nr:SLC13 family permease [Herbiconiux sp. L3-i23]BDI22917.1 arsenic transporter [Herbiconiux sp. L3-i23]